MDQARALGEEYGVDTRQGSLFMDAATGHCIRIAKFMNDLSTAFEMLAVDTCTGDVLTEKAAQDGIYRQSATPSYYEVSFTGTTPELGSRFFVESCYFKLISKDDRFLLESEVLGTATNSILPVSIAWKVAEKAVKEGATITLSNTPVAVRMGEVSALSEKLNCEVIPADATSVEDLENVFKRSMEVLGGPVDFVLHSIGMSPNVRKKRTYDDLDYDMLEKTLDISAVSFHKMIQAAKKLNAIADYGSILALSYVAAQRTFYGYNDMADAKALLESIARSFGYIYGREHHVRVNTISQSPTMTTAGSGVKGMDKLFDFANRMSPLGNASADECADYCIVMFSDLTRKVTMQNLFHDGGFSSVGMSLRAMATYEKGLDEYKDENGNIIYG